MLVLQRLLEAALLTSGDVVSTGVRTTPLSRSNEVHVVWVGERPSLVVKVAAPGTERWEQGDPALERRLLPLLSAGDGLVVPRCLPAPDDMLVMHFVGEGTTLSEAVRSGLLPRTEAARLVGRAVAELPVGDDLPLDLPAVRPWVLRTVEDPLPGFLAEHPPARALLEEILDDDLRFAVSAAAASWTSGHLVHGDVRWDNVVLDADRAALLDWEFAGLGDSVWDVACAMAEHLAWGSLGPDVFPDLQVAPDRSAAQAVAVASGELEALAEAYRDWASRLGRGVDPEQVLDRSATWTALRLLQVALQWTFWDPDDGERRARFVARVARALLLEAAPDIRGTEA